MLPKETFDLLVASFGDIVADFTEGPGIKAPFCRVQPERLLEVARTLRDHPALQFDFLENVTAVDWPKRASSAPPSEPGGSGGQRSGAAEGAPRTGPPGEIEVVYHLFSYSQRHGFAVKVTLGRDAPAVASLTSLWDSAEWLEREQYDLLGVKFEGHPDLRRLLLPEDWQGHPLRKDYQQAPEYRGMSTSRPQPLDLLPKFDAHSQAQSAQRPGGEK
jgi:NADH-quinone oxidoreductase subunit C